MKVTTPENDVLGQPAWVLWENLAAVRTIERVLGSATEVKEGRRLTSIESTVLESLLGCIADARPDVLVAEAGASPLEPYCGDLAVAGLRDWVRCTVLCASDPYAVVGVMKGFGFDPDLVSGVATSTSAGVKVIRQLAGTPALNLLNPKSHEQLDQLLRERLGI